MTARPEPQGPPSDFNALRKAVLARHPTLPKRLQQVARFALDHPEDMALSTVAEVARGAGVQPSALIRFAQLMGYSGFSELQTLFRTRLRHRWPDYQARLAALRETGGGQDGIPRLLDGFIEASVTSLMHLRETVGDAALERAVAVLTQARTIFLLGQRRAFPAASYLAYAFGKLGLRAVLLDDAGGMLADKAQLAECGDVLLAISFMPYTPSTVEIAAEVAARGVSVVAITDSAVSPLAAVAATWLEVAEADRGAFRSLAATFALALTLAIATAERRQAAGTIRLPGVPAGQS